MSFYFSILVMIFKKTFYKSLTLLIAFGVVSSFIALKAQTASSLDKAKVVSFSVENDLVNRYLQHAETAYGDGIGRSGISILCYWLLEPGESPYMHEVPESGGRPKWAEQCAPIKIPAAKGNSVLVSTSPYFEKFVSVVSDCDEYPTFPISLPYNRFKSEVFPTPVLPINTKPLSFAFNISSSFKLVSNELISIS